MCACNPSSGVVCSSCWVGPAERYFRETEYCFHVKNGITYLVEWNLDGSASAWFIDPLDDKWDQIYEPDMPRFLDEVIRARKRAKNNAE